MNRFIKLRDIAHIETPPHKEYTQTELRAGRDVVSKRNLRFNNLKGIMRDNTGELSRYSNPRDFTPHATLDEIMKEQFFMWIANSASRVRRGYSP